MKLTIIPNDGAVYKDGVCYEGLSWEGTPIDVNALQWFDVEGWIEYKEAIKPNEPITVLPDWANNAIAAWDVANTPQPPVPPTAEQNKQTASQLLYLTDWTTIPDVSDPTKSNPYLGNANEFIAYRNQVRQVAINPVAGYIDFPTEPTAQWVSV
jgi:hypothetical protein